jgi:c(7)-type cytochrome triheme protein
MSKRWFLIVTLLLLAVPAVSYALDMGGMGMGGMAAMGGKVEIQTKSVGKVVFDHTVHGTNCSQCHPKLFKKSLNNPHLTMKQMERHRGCGFCHNGYRAFTVKANCTKCHAGDILFKVPDVGNVTFPHSTHIGMFGCDSCHPDLFKAEHGANKMTMKAMENGQFCGACHDGNTAFSVKDACDSCHKM